MLIVLFNSLLRTQSLDILVKIKKLAISRRVVFTAKARSERISDGLTVEDVIEAIVNAPSINKILRSTSTSKKTRKEKLYIIISSSYDGKIIYTKGTIRKVDGIDEFYILISSKWSQYE